MLALEIAMTVPIFFGIGLALSALSSLSSLEADCDVKWWAEYSKDTKIGCLEFETGDFTIEVTSWIYWEYWKYFDLYYPVPDMEFDMGNIMDILVQDSTHPPTLHCGYNQIGDSSKYDFVTTYTDWDNDPPEYVKLVLIDPEGGEHDYNMEENEGSYDIGVLYNITIDFENDFQDLNGQWFYYFKTKENAEDYGDLIVKQPANYSFEIGPYFGKNSTYLLYSSVYENSTQSIIDEFVWDFQLLNFTVSACDFALADNVDPEEVNMNILFPDGTIESIEMEESYSEFSINPNTNSPFYDSQFTEYSVLLNLSEYYDFDENKAEIICYYFNASLSDGSHSNLYNANPENNNFTWYYVLLKHFESEKSWIVGYEVKELVWPRTWDSWENYGIEFFGATAGVNRVIQPICDEHVLRFTTWIVHSNGTHEEIYNKTGFEFKPVLTLWKVDNPSESFDVEMAWAGYDTGMNADEYFVEVLGDSHYTYVWEDISGLDNEFGPGVWKFKVSVEDFNGNITNLYGSQKIWRTGSFQSMWNILWGSPFTDEEDWLMNFFGIWRPIITSIGFIGAAALAIAQKSPADRIFALGTTMFDIITRFVGLGAFLMKDDTGALLGLAMNSLLTGIMMLFVLELGSLSRLIKYGTGSRTTGENIFSLNALNMGVYKNPLNRFTAILSKITRVLALLNVMLMVFCNPGALVILGPYTMLLGLMFLYKRKTDESGGFGWKKTLLTFGVTALSFLLSGLIENGLGMTEFLESDNAILFNNIASFLSFLPIQMITLLVTSLSLGVILNFLGFQDKETINGKSAGFKIPTQDRFNSLVSGGKGIVKAVALYTVLSFAIAGVSFMAFEVQSGYGYVAFDIFQELLSSEIEDKDYDNYQNYGTSYEGE